MILIISGQLSANFAAATQQPLIMGIVRQIAEYLYLKKPDPKQEKTQWTKYMHGINRISIFIFLFGLLVLLVRWVIIPLFK
jgi:hypothetical protein